MKRTKEENERFQPMFTAIAEKMKNQLSLKQAVIR
jgi:hypothetical protein